VLERTQKVFERDLAELERLIAREHVCYWH
jgi:hypothetical protein